jgi:hypothetical protein
MEYADDVGVDDEEDSVVAVEKLPHLFLECVVLWRERASEREGVKRVDRGDGATKPCFCRP